MSQFPPAVNLAPEVSEARKKRLKHLMFSAWLAIVFRITIVVAEMAGVIYSGSNTLYVDAIFNLIDITFSLLLILSIKLATKPPDEEHPFGHGRYEPLMGLQSGLFLCLVGVGLFIQQIVELGHSAPNRHLDQPIWMIPLVAVILLEISYRILIKAAKKENSPALRADAMHYRVDSLTSLFAVFALVFADLFSGWSLFFDHAGALIISVMMVGFGISSSRHNLHQVMDKTPDDSYFEKVKLAAKNVEGVIDIEKVRIQLYGPDAHVDIDIEVDPMLPVDLAHKISQKARVAIQHAWPAVRDVTVHIEPYYPNDH